jgi:hypothetical protein
MLGAERLQFEWEGHVELRKPETQAAWATLLAIATGQNAEVASIVSHFQGGGADRGKLILTMDSTVRLDVEERLRGLLSRLQAHGFDVLRMKLEQAHVDSKRGDVL